MLAGLIPDPEDDYVAEAFLSLKRCNQSVDVHVNFSERAALSTSKSCSVDHKNLLLL